MEFVVHGLAQPAGSKKGFVNPKTGRVIITDDAKKSRPWKAIVTDAAVKAMDGRPRYDQALSVSFVFVVPEPKTHRTSTGALSAAGKRQPWPTTRPDLLKLARAIEDALTGVVYRDDSLIVQERLIKDYCRDDESPHVRIIILPM